VATIIVEQGPGKGATLKLERDGEYLVGSDEICHLTLPSPSVEPKQVLVRFAGGRCRVQDLVGGTKAVFVNDERVIRKVVRDGDRILIGDCLLRFRSDQVGPAMRRTLSLALVGGSAKARRAKALVLGFFCVTVVALVACRGLPLLRLGILAGALVLVMFVVADSAFSMYRKSLGRFRRQCVSVLTSEKGADIERIGIDELDEVFEMLQRHVRETKEAGAKEIGGRKASGRAADVAGIVHVIDSAAVAVDSDNRIVSANKPFADLVGVSHQHAQDCHLLDLARLSEEGARIARLIEHQAAEAPGAASHGVRRTTDGDTKVASVNIGAQGDSMRVYVFCSQ